MTDNTACGSIIITEGGIPNNPAAAVYTKKGLGPYICTLEKAVEISTECESLQETLEKLSRKLPLHIGGYFLSDWDGSFARRTACLHMPDCCTITWAVRYSRRANRKSLARSLLQGLQYMTAGGRTAAATWPWLARLLCKSSAHISCLLVLWTAALRF